MNWFQKNHAGSHEYSRLLKFGLMRADCIILLDLFIHVCLHNLANHTQDEDIYVKNSNTTAHQWEVQDEYIPGTLSYSHARQNNTVGSYCCLSRVPKPL